MSITTTGKPDAGQEPHNTDKAKYLAAQDAVIAPAGTKINGVDVGGTVQCWVTTQPAFATLYPGCVPINVFDPNGLPRRLSTI